jgi:UDP:flavonoid glycosyltransferase YjiC (YdhE family)
MRILFASTRHAGHFGPLIPFAQACRRAGHDVLVAAAGSLAHHVERAGLPHAPLADPRPEVLEPLWQRLRAGDPREADRIMVTEVFAGEHAHSALPGMLETMRAWRPDVVLRETCEFSSVVAAEALGIPHVHASIFLAMDTAFDWHELAAPMDGLRERAGLGPDPRPERLWEDPYLTLAPRSLEHPGSSPHPDVRRFREPSAPPRPLPDWWSGSEDPLVYVSFGSVAAGSGFFPRLYREALDALAGLPVRVLMTVGTDVDPTELGPLPDAVHVEPWVTQAAVTPHAAAMVGHGGSGSTLMAMAAALPMAVVPLFADQRANAARVAALGAGIALGPVMSGGDPRSLLAEAAADQLGGLRDAVAELLDDPRYRGAARAVAAEIAQHPPVDDAVALLADAARGAALGV